ncbi:MAG: YncE family protein [Gammaproteobacteria bacterium]|nr:YncE family protein [Gammaproteobacteria bacterium]
MQSSAFKWGGLTLVLALAPWLPAWGADDAKAAAEPAAPAAAAEAPAEAAAEVARIERDGVVVELEVKPTEDDADKVVASDWADVTFRLTDANTGQPLKGRYPAAWMDLGEAWEAKGDRPMSCRDRVATYLQGIVGVRPMIDLNSHFLLVLNRDASISVIDPAVGITGITNLFAQINLDKPGADWVLGENDKQLFVTMPLAGQIAVADTETFKVTTNVDAGTNPTRIELQRDGRYLWVGNNSDDADKGGVTVIDADTLEHVAFIATGAGHHEIGFTDDDRLAFVTNRDSGTVSVIDVQKLAKVADIATGDKPVGMDYSTLGQALYVADARDGVISVIDPKTLEIRARLQTVPGLGPLRFSKDGRWGVVVNPAENQVFVIDASSDAIAHKINIGKQPFHVSFTRSFAYIRSLGTADVALIPLSELDLEELPPATYIPAGQRPPGLAADLSIADSIVPSVKEGAAAYIVNQADGTVHYYMEGMGAPMGAFRNYGHEARAIEIVDRSLAEQAPGVYTGRVKVPVEGTYDIAFMMDTPRFLHCFTTVVEPNPDAKATTAKLAVEYQIGDRRVAVGERVTVRFRMTNPRTSLPVSDIDDMTVMFYRSDGRGRQVLPAKALGDGVYEVEVAVASASTWYLFVGSSSQELSFSDLPFLSLMGMPPSALPDAQASTGGRP